MTARISRRFVVLVVWPLALTGCGRAAPALADPMLDAIRAEERVGGLSYGEGQGKYLFAQYCATCHGDEGKGDGQNASNLNPAPPDLTSPKNVRDAAYLRRAIAQGSAAVGRSPLSPPWGRSLSTQQIGYLVAYCQALARPKRQGSSTLTSSGLIGTCVSVTGSLHCSSTAGAASWLERPRRVYSSSRTEETRGRRRTTAADVTHTGSRGRPAGGRLRRDSPFRLEHRREGRTWAGQGL